MFLAIPMIYLPEMLSNDKYKRMGNLTNGEYLPNLVVGAREYKSQ
jgi:hypothetical protein